MTRLTAHIRDGIIAKAVETSGINERNRALVESRALFAEKIRQLCLTKEGVTDADLRKHIEKVLNTSNSFVTGRVQSDTSSYFRANINGANVCLYMDGATDPRTSTHLSESYFSGQKNKKTRVFLPVSRPDIADQALFDEFKELEQLQAAVNNEIVVLRASVKDAVSKFTTVEKLLENWPEAKELLPEAEAKSVGTGLALDKETLNNLCGISQPK